MGLVGVKRSRASAQASGSIRRIWEAFLDPKAWCLTIAMFGSSVPNGILTNFSGTIIKDMGFSTFEAALLDCAGRSFQIISLIIAGLVAN
ncbi:hypothetical protein JCM8208_005145 [Rhodotorula glutinis]